MGQSLYDAVRSCYHACQPQQDIDYIINATQRALPSIPFCTNEKAKCLLDAGVAIVHKKRTATYESHTEMMMSYCLLQIEPVQKKNRLKNNMYLHENALRKTRAVVENNAYLCIQANQRTVEKMHGVECYRRTVNIITVH
jgi:hypothetical protein